MKIQFRNVDGSFSAVLNQYNCVLRFQYPKRFEYILSLNIVPLIVVID